MPDACFLFRLLPFGCDLARLQTLVAAPLATIQITGEILFRQ
jgi:hypothetical protein